MSIRRVLIVIFAAALTMSVNVAAHASNSQQAKMTQCNADAKAKSLAGHERKEFMKGCLSGHHEAAKRDLTAQQQKMKSCSADAKAKGLKGTGRRSFMSTCLKGH